MSSPVSGVSPNSPLSFAYNYLDPQLSGINQDVQSTLSSLSSSSSSSDSSGGGSEGIVSGLTHGIPLLGGITDGLHKAVSSIPVVGGLLGSIF